jgi:hypothetical protein
MQDKDQQQEGPPISESFSFIDILVGVPASAHSRSSMSLPLLFSGMFEGSGSLVCSPELEQRSEDEAERIFALGDDQLIEEINSILDIVATKVHDSKTEVDKLIGDPQSNDQVDISTVLEHVREIHKKLHETVHTLINLSNKLIEADSVHADKVVALSIDLRLKESSTSLLHRMVASRV